MRLDCDSPLLNGYMQNLNISRQERKLVRNTLIPQKSFFDFNGLLGHMIVHLYNIYYIYGWKVCLCVELYETNQHFLWKQFFFIFCNFQRNIYLILSFLGVIQNSYFTFICLIFSSVLAISSSFFLRLNSYSLNRFESVIYNKIRPKHG